MAADTTRINPSLEEVGAVAGQIPAYVHDEQQLRRWKLCFAATLVICRRYDRRFCDELFHGDIATDAPTVPASG